VDLGLEEVEVEEGLRGLGLCTDGGLVAADGEGLDAVDDDDTRGCGVGNGAAARGGVTSSRGREVSGVVVIVRSADAERVKRPLRRSLSSLCRCRTR
jgi:hypothetical protein